MNWFYVEAGQQRGPVTEADLENLLRTGQIQRDTLIWQEGMAQWQPYHVARPSVAAPPVAPGYQAPPLAGGAVCVECGKLFPTDEVIQYGNSHVCAACKPIFLQKVREGVALPVGAMDYAGFWIRFGAKFVDGIILRIAATAVGMILGAIMAKGEGQAAFLIVSSLLGVAMNALYCMFFVGKYGATPGKMAAKLRIVNADGSNLSYGKALVRYFAELLSLFTLFIGYIMAGFDPEKRALHDRICGTRVIKK